MPKVSVVVPIYNAGTKLHKCIKSILKQTFKEFELILVNDGSTDESLRMCMDYQRNDNRIKVVNKKNEGSIATRKKGVIASKGNYVMFVDADDWIEASTLETLYDEVMKNDLDVAVCNMSKVVGRGLLKSKGKSPYFVNNKIYNEEEIKRDLVTAYFFGHPFPSSLFAKLYKRELLLSSGSYLHKIHFFGEDLFLNLEILLKAKKIKMIDEHLYNYRYGGFTSKYQPHFFDDMINGYKIQKEVINHYYYETKEENYKGICIMLLNTYKACLVNLFMSEFTEREIKNIINSYLSDKSINEAIINEGSVKYFHEEYLNAFKNKNTEYFYSIGKEMHKKASLKRYALNFISRVV